MSRRIILVLIEPPAPFGNAAGRWFSVLLRGLVGRGHRVAALATSSDPGHAAEAARLFPGPEFDLRIFPEPPPDRRPMARLATLRRPYSYMFGPEIRRALAEEVARGFDVLHLEQTWSGWLGLGHEPRSVLNVHYLARIDLADGPRSTMLDQARSALVRRAEAGLLRRYPWITALSPRLTGSVRAISPGSEVRTVPLGIDVGLYPFEPDPPPRPPTVALIGSFGWRPTYLAGVRLLTRLWPEIRARVPEARLLLVGRRARVALGHLAAIPGVEVAEDVADAIPYFQAADVLLYPTPQGSGMKVKVLEAFALGTPVVTTTDGVEGLPAVDGVHAGIADDDAGLVARTVALLLDPAARVRHRLAARALLEEHCGPKPTLDAVEAVHARVAGGTERSAGR